MDPFLLRQVFEIISSEESRDNAQRPVPAANQIRDHLQSFMQIPIDLLSGIVHIGEETSRNEGDFIAVLFMVKNDLLL